MKNIKINTKLLSVFYENYNFGNDKQISFLNMLQIKNDKHFKTYRIIILYKNESVFHVTLS